MGSQKDYRRTPNGWQNIAEAYLFTGKIIRRYLDFFVAALSSRSIYLTNEAKNHYN